MTKPAIHPLAQRGGCQEDLGMNYEEIEGYFRSLSPLHSGLKLIATLNVPQAYFRKDELIDINPRKRYSRFDSF